VGNNYIEEAETTIWSRPSTGHAQADVGAVLHEVHGVVALERVAAREHHQLVLAELAGLVEESLGLLGGEFVGVAVGLGVGPAVFAGQVAGLRQLPDEDERPLVGVHSSGRPGGT
jgi:hypothetical protein